MTSADFIQNLLPNSNILERELLKKITKLSFESERSGIFTRYTQQPVKSVQTILPQKKLHQILKNTSQHSFVNFQVDIQTDYYPHQKKIECELSFVETAAQRPGDVLRMGMVIKYLDKSRPFLKDQIITEIQKKSSSSRKMKMCKMWSQIDSDLSVKLVIDTRRIVPIQVIRQDLLHLDFENHSYGKSTLSVNVDPTMDIFKVSELLKDIHGFAFHCLWYLEGLVICSDVEDEVGHLLFRNSIHGGLGCHFFLEVSNETLNMILPSHFLCMIYTQDKIGTDTTIQFVKNMVMKQPDQMRIDDIFIHAIKYASGAKYEERVDIKFSALKSSHSGFGEFCLKVTQHSLRNYVFLLFIQIK